MVDGSSRENGSGSRLICGGYCSARISSNDTDRRPKVVSDRWPFGDAKGKEFRFDVDLGSTVSTCTDGATAISDDWTEESSRFPVLNTALNPKPYKYRSPGGKAARLTGTLPPWTLLVSIEAVHHPVAEDALDDHEPPMAPHG